MMHKAVYSDTSQMTKGTYPRLCEAEDLTRNTKERSVSDRANPEKKKCGRVLVKARRFGIWNRNELKNSRIKTRIVWLFVGIEPEGNDGQFHVLS